MAFFLWLENTAVSTWIRESPTILAFPFILYLHTLGLALIAGLSSAVALTILTQPSVPARLLYKLFPLMWVGLAINAVSGLALLIAYPAKALTNPVFYIKLVAIAIAVGIVQWLQHRFARGIGVEPDFSGSVAASRSQPTMKRAAWTLLILWAIATLTGRLLAYTYSILMASFAI